MDPSEYYCRIVNSFDKKQSVQRYDNDILTTSYTSVNSDFTPKIKFNKASPSNIFENIFCDQSLYNELLSIKDANFKRDGFLKARNATNPFEKIGNSIFFDRAAVKLANIDSIFMLTSLEYVDDDDKVKELSSQFGGLLAPQMFDKFYFCDVAGGPGGWTQYIQYRRPGSIGFGITLNDENKWNSEIINTDNFEYIYGEDNTGNIYNNSKYFIDYVLEKVDHKIDLVCADGGFSVTDREEVQETVSSRLIFCECFIAANVIRNNRHFVCKIFDTNTKFMVDLIYLMSLLFDSVYIFKPISSRPANAERYLICRELIESSRVMILKIMTDMYNNYTEDMFYTSIFETLPENYVKWITEYNNLNLRRQYDYAQLIVKYLNKESIDIPIYNTYKALILWNIPDNNDNKIEKGIYPRRYNQKGFLPRTSKSDFIASNEASNFRVNIGKRNKRDQNKVCTVR